MPAVRRMSPSTHMTTRIAVVVPVRRNRHALGHRRRSRRRHRVRRLPQQPDQGPLVRARSTGQVVRLEPRQGRATRPQHRHLAHLRRSGRRRISERHPQRVDAPELLHLPRTSRRCEAHARGAARVARWSRQDARCRPSQAAPRRHRPVTTSNRDSVVERSTR